MGRTGEMSRFAHHRQRVLAREPAPGAAREEDEAAAGERRMKQMTYADELRKQVGAARRGRGRGVADHVRCGARRSRRSRSARTLRSGALRRRTDG